MEDRHVEIPFLDPGVQAYAFTSARIGVAVTEAT
jgi:hypothetical protein